LKKTCWQWNEKMALLRASVENELGLFLANSPNAKMVPHWKKSELRSFLVSQQQKSFPIIRKKHTQKKIFRKIFASNFRVGKLRNM
jgi:hypothetical protein